MNKATARRYALTWTTPTGVPYLFLKDRESLVLTLKMEEAKFFKTKIHAQNFYTNFVLPNVLIGEDPLQILNSISEIELELTSGMDYPLSKKGVKQND